VIKLRRIIWVGHVACRGEMRNEYKMLVEPEGTRKLRTWRHRMGRKY